MAGYKPRFAQEIIDKLLCDDNSNAGTDNIKSGANIWHQRQTCIWCNSSKDGTGYVVLQQYCQSSKQPHPVVALMDGD